MLGFIGIRRLSFANLVQRSFSSSAYERAMSREKVKLTFIGKLDEKIQVDAFVGDTLLDVSQQNSLDVEGACGGSMACSTCHMIFEPEVYKQLPPPSEAEEDTLELAVDPTVTSRLGCQVTVTKDLDGAVIHLPKKVVNKLID